MSERLPGYATLAEVEDAVGGEVLATSREGRPVRGAWVGPPEGDLALVVAGIHAMEWIGVEVALGLLAALRAAPPSRRVLVVPVLNPDGFARAAGDLAAGRRRFVRANGAGVDLNRNFPTHWRPTRFPQSAFPFLGTAGTHPRSEPEVDGLCRAVDPHAGRLRRAVSLHSIGNKLLVPPGGVWALPPEHGRHRAHAEAVNAALGGAYHVTAPTRWVPGISFAPGMELDHFHAWGAEPLLVEISAGGLAPTDPGSWLHPLRWFNPPDPRPHVSALVPALLPFLLG